MVFATGSVRLAELSSKHNISLSSNPNAASSALSSRRVCWKTSPVICYVLFRGFRSLVDKGRLFLRHGSVFFFFFLSTVRHRRPLRCLIALESKMQNYETNNNINICTDYWLVHSDMTITTIRLDFNLLLFTSADELIIIYHESFVGNKIELVWP